MQADLWFVQYVHTSVYCTRYKQILINKFLFAYVYNEENVIRTLIFKEKRKDNCVVVFQAVYRYLEILLNAIARSLGSAYGYEDGYESLVRSIQLLNRMLDS